jgi:Ribosomal protein L13e
LRPAVRGQTNRYNSKIKLGRGFTKRELALAGVSSLPYARSIGIAVDLRRRDTCNETLNLNVNRVKTYLSKIILHRKPTKSAKNVPNKLVKEINFEEHQNDPNIRVQNTSREVIRKYYFKFFMKYSFTNIFSSTSTRIWIYMDNNY